jgi:hypothetical protein
MRTRATLLSRPRAGIAFAAIAAALALAAPRARATIVDAVKIDLDFPPAAGAPRASWSTACTVGPAGLRYAGETGPDGLHGWIESARVPIGLAWRPPTSLRLALAVTGTAAPDAPIQAFVRYGADGARWSPWIALPEARLDDYGARPLGLDAPLRTWKGDIAIAEVDRKPYDDLMDEWRKTGPDWVCDEDALCRWIARERPGFFDRAIPFIGYIEIRLEMPAGAPVAIGAVRGLVTFAVSGLATIPKRGEEPPLDARWKFER